MILHTNDTHCGLEDGMGFEGVAAYRNEMEAMYGADHVTLVDAGDAIQGGPIGKLTTGQAIVDIMNQVGYDVFVLGNHEFDYQVPRMMELMSQMQAKVISSNFMDLAKGEPVYEPYTIISQGGIDVAYIGITTPESFTKSTPTYFQDTNGAFIYGFEEGNQGKDLYENVQASVDKAKAEGAEYIVAVGHLGIEETSAPWRSYDVIANTTGIDVFIDGHSHSMIEGEVIKDKAGEDVILNQTGTKFEGIGKVMINPTTDMITAEVVKEYEEKDTTVAGFINGINQEFEEILNQVVAKTETPLAVTDPATGERMIRNRETNLGNLVADGYRVTLEADVALVNGGGIRADIEVGDITNEEIINVHPFGNNGTTVRVSGQVIQDALEMGAQNAPGESGGFLHVSGMTYTIDTTIPSSVKTDDQGAFLGVEGAYRVKDIMIAGQPIDLNQSYVVASHDYLLLSYGDGMTMFKDAEVVKDRVIVDNEILINYIKENLGGVVGDSYANVYGENRITVLTEQMEESVPMTPLEPATPAGESVPMTPLEPATPTEESVPMTPLQPAMTTESGYRIYIVVKGDNLYEIAEKELGDGSLYYEIYRLNEDEITDMNEIYVGQELKLPS